MSTNIGSGAREALGLLLRGFRENFYERLGQPNKEQLSRKKLAGRVRVSEDVIKNLEHGIPNPERSVFERTIRELRLLGDDSDEAYRLLNLFSVPVPPHKRHRIKFDLPFDAKVRRNHSRVRFY